MVSTTSGWSASSTVGLQVERSLNRLSRDLTLELHVTSVAKVLEQVEQDSPDSGLFIRRILNEDPGDWIPVIEEQERPGTEIFRLACLLTEKKTAQALRPLQSLGCRDARAMSAGATGCCEAQQSRSRWFQASCWSIRGTG